MRVFHRALSKMKTRSSTKKDEATQNPATTEDAAKDTTAPSKDPSEDHDFATNIVHFTVPCNEKQIVCHRHHPPGSASSPASLVFTHGAGGGISAPATRDFARGFGFISPVTCFEGTLHLGNRVKAFHAVVSHSDGAVALGGRSMGARAAVLTALEMEEKPEALVLVSWPLMAGSKGDKREPERREKILLDLPGDLDVLFVVGDRDAQCDVAQLAELREGMKAKSWLVVVKGADHGMGLTKKKGDEAMRFKTGAVAAEWLNERDAAKRYCALEWDQDEEEVTSTGWQEAAH